VWQANETKSITPESNSTEFEKEIPLGKYEWNCRVRDTLGGSAFAPKNFTFFVLSDNGCKIYGASINKYCTDQLNGQLACRNGDKIEVDVVVDVLCLNYHFMGVHGSIKAVSLDVNYDPLLPIPHPMKIEINASNTACTPIGNPDRRSCTANWTVEIPPNANGVTFVPRYIDIYNSTGWELNNWLASYYPVEIDNFTLFQSSVSSFPCNITGAGIQAYCTDPSRNCRVGDNITINISVEDITKCSPASVNKIEMYTIQVSGPDETMPEHPCRVYLKNSTRIQWNPNPGNQYFYANSTINSISQNCRGADMKAINATLYNGTGSVNKIGEKIGDFGVFTFSDYVPSTECAITAAGIKPLCNSNPEKKCVKGDKIEINATYLEGCGAVDSLLIKALNDSSSPSCEVWLQNDSCSGTLCKGTYKILGVSPECAGKLVIPYVAEIFKQGISVASFDEVSGNFTFNDTVQWPDCNVTSANIINYCGGNGCHTGDNITLNATLSGGTGCNGINKINMLAENTSSGIQTDVMMSANCATSSENCYGNWTISSSVYNALKNLKMDVLYVNLKDNSNTIKAEEFGNFGHFNFTETIVRECYCDPPYNLIKCDVDCYNRTHMCISSPTGPSISGCDENEYCDDSSGRPVCRERVSPSHCHDSSAEYRACNSSSNFGQCYWDNPSYWNLLPPNCKHCDGGTVEGQTYGAVESCDMYENEISCTDDSCRIGVTALECSQQGGLNCHCEWNSVSGCSLKFQQNGSLCNINAVFSACSEGCDERQGYKQRNMTCLVSLPDCTADQCSTLGYPKSDCLRCGGNTQRLPFFEPWQILIVLVMLAGYYFLCAQKRDK
jgi:hypothetical protein